MIIRKRNEPKKSLESFLFWQSLGMYFINREDFRQIFSIKYGDFFFSPQPRPPSSLSFRSPHPSAQRTLTPHLVHSLIPFIS